MYDRIVVPLDTGTNSERVTDFAFEFADATGAALSFVYVIDPSEIPPELRETSEYERTAATANERAERTLDALLERGEQADVSCSTAVREGETIETLRSYVESVDADLCLVEREGERKLFGFLWRSFAERLARVSDVPILSLPSEEPLPALPFSRVLLATDGQSNSKRAERHAISLAASLQAALYAVYVVSERFANSPLADVLLSTGTEITSQLERRAAENSVEFHAKTREGDPAEEIVDAADEHNVHLIVVGTSARAGFDRLVLGSVAGGVLRRSSRPVLVVGNNDER